MLNRIAAVGICTLALGVGACGQPDTDSENTQKRSANVTRATVEPGVIATIDPPASNGPTVPAANSIINAEPVQPLQTEQVVLDDGTVLLRVGPKGHTIPLVTTIDCEGNLRTSHARGQQPEPNCSSDEKP